MKPIVLPDLPMNLKRAQEANQLNLEKVGIFYFICWIQNSSRIAFVDQVNQSLIQRKQNKLGLMDERSIYEFRVQVSIFNFLLVVLQKDNCP